MRINEVALQGQKVEINRTCLVSTFVDKENNSSSQWLGVHY